MITTRDMILACQRTVYDVARFGSPSYDHRLDVTYRLASTLQSRGDAAYLTNRRWQGWTERTRPPAKLAIQALKSLLGDFAWLRGVTDAETRHKYNGWWDDMLGYQVNPCTVTREVASLRRIRGK